MAEKFGVGDFVTAYTVKPLGNHTETGESNPIRQGIISKVNDDNTVIVQGETGERYHCKADVAVVPDENIWGTAKDFVIKFRAALN